MYRPTKSQRVLLGIVDTTTPVWKDHCGHGPHTYVCTFESIYADAMKRACKEVLDMHLWHGNKVCLRHGDDPGAYYSPGTVAEILKGSHMMESYRNAAAILLAMGRIIWVQHTHTPVQDDISESDLTKLIAAAKGYCAEMSPHHVNRDAKIKSIQDAINRIRPNGGDAA